MRSISREKIKRSYTVLFFALMLIFCISASQVWAADWQLVRTLKSGRTWRAVTYGNGLYVAVGDRWTAQYGGDEKALVYTSPDGRTWTKRSIDTGLNLYGVTYGGGLYIAVGKDGQIFSSPDGTTWTQRRGAVSEYSLTCVAYNGTDLFVAGGLLGYICTSPDGITWTQRYCGYSNQVDALCYAQGKWVAACSSGNAMYSSNGTSWTKINGLNVTVNLKSVVYANGLFVLGGGSGTCFTSPDGVTWTKRTTSQPNYLWAMSWTGGHYVACGNSDGVGCSMALVSANGTTWVRDRTTTYKSLLGTASNGSNVIGVGIQENVIWNSVGSIGDGNGCGTTPPPPTNTITITSPSASSIWAPGSTHDITWKGSKKYTTIDIEYSDGKTWKSVVTGTADDGAYSWTVPNTPTSAAQIWIKGWETSGNATDKSDIFKISGTAPVENTITITYPNGGETLPAGSQQVITWKTTGVITKVDIEYTLDNKKTWHSLVTGAANSGSYTWNVPATMATTCYLWVKGWGNANGNDTDYSDNSFKIGSGITVTSPNGGENWSAGSQQTITWTTAGTVGNVKIDYSLNLGSSWVNLTTSTPNDGSFPWTLPAGQSSQCLVRISEISGNKATDNSNAAFTIGGPPSVVLDKSTMTFTAIQGGAGAAAQTLGITNGGGGSLNWTGSVDSGWLSISPSSGTGNGSTTVSANVSGLSVGQYTGTITITDASEGLAKTVTVTLNVINEGQDMPPFGMLATPTDATGTVSGSIAVTGWALDDMGVSNLKIYRNVDGELSFIGDAVFVEGARPDIEAAYPTYPYNNRAGWGYMLLTNFLPDGNLTLVAVAIDTTGHQVQLGSATVTVDNAHAVKPFGAIDTPTQGGVISGNKYRNNGWALTPKPNTIPTNGSTINVYVDGVAIGKATYNLYRQDIATLFPGYMNSNNAWGYFDINTTSYSNGLHTIQWSVTDNKGNTDGIGSRYFKILNTSSKSSSSVSRVPQEITVAKDLTDKTLANAENTVGMSTLKTDYNPQSAAQKLSPDADGKLHVQVSEKGRIELSLGAGKGTYYRGYSVENNAVRPLPVGSTLDSTTGTFYWQPGVGFMGTYQLVFETTGKISKKIPVEVTITPEVK